MLLLLCDFDTSGRTLVNNYSLRLFFFCFRCTIDLSKLEREITHNIWQELEDGNGQIFLLLTISGTTQSETITDLASYRENPRDIEIIEKRYVSLRYIVVLCNKIIKHNFNIDF